MYIMAECDPLQRRQLLESTARLIGDAEARAHRLGLLEVVEILREAQRAAIREASGRDDGAPDARWQAVMH